MAVSDFLDIFFQESFSGRGLHFSMGGDSFSVGGRGGHGCFKKKMGWGWGATPYGPYIRGNPGMYKKKKVSVNSTGHDLDVSFL